MEDVKAQIIILATFIMAIGLALIVVLANNILLSLNYPGIEDVQENVKIGDIASIYEENALEILNYVESKGLDEENATKVMLAHMSNLSQLIERLYASHGIAVETEINVTASKIIKTYNVSQKGSIVRIVKHEFSKGSIIIPVDDNQWFLKDSDSSNDKLSARIFGLIYRTLNDRNENATKLDDYTIPVYRLLEDPRGPARDNINDPLGIPYAISVKAKKIVDGKNQTEVSGDVKTITLKGGPFIIDSSDLDSSKRQMLIDEAKNLSVDLYELKNDFEYNWTAYILGAPRLAVYPEDSNNIDIVIEYFKEAGLTDNEFLSLNTTEIEQDALNDVDILFTPHTDISEAYDPSKNLTDTAAWKILRWVEEGGVYHVECYGIETVDSTIEKADGNRHPWYGFIGVENDPNKYGKNYEGEILDTIFTNNATLFVTQVYTVDGRVNPRGGHTPSFYFKSSHNPYAISLIETVVGDAIVMAYAPFERGHLVYMGGHKQNIDDSGVPTPARLTLVFNAFMLARAAKLQPQYTLKAYINIKYNDGKSEFTKNLNIVINKTLENYSFELPNQYKIGNLDVSFIYPFNGYVLSGKVNVLVSSNAQNVSLYLDDNFVGDMHYNSSNGYWELSLDTTHYEDGYHLLKAYAVNGSRSASTYIYVNIQNAVSNPGSGADWEGKIEVETHKDFVRVRFEVWYEENGNKIPLDSANIIANITKKDGSLLYSGILGFTASDGKFEFRIKKEDENAVLIIEKGSDNGSDLEPDKWKFKNNKEYYVKITVEKDGKIQYFDKKFKYKK